MDTMIKDIDINGNELNKIINEMINLDGKDDINYEILKINDIRVEDKYGSIRISLLGTKEELKVNLKLEDTES